MALNRPKMAPKRPLDSATNRVEETRTKSGAIAWEVRKKTRMGSQKKENDKPKTSISLGRSSKKVKMKDFRVGDCFGNSAIPFESGA